MQLCTVAPACSDGEGGGAGGQGIEDNTNFDIVTLRRNIYLTIMSALSYEETCHKLMKLKMPDGLEVELINMVLECCSQVRRGWGTIRTCMRVCVYVYVYVCVYVYVHVPFSPHFVTWTCPCTPCTAVCDTSRRRPTPATLA